MSDFNELREIDVSKHIEKKGQFSYLSWNYAVDYLLQKDPQATWQFHDPITFKDGSMMVSCTVTAFGVDRFMQLPVMDHRNNAIQNPDAFAVNKAMQRCLAKAIACHGIGLYIYAGEDLPDASDAKKTSKPKKKPEYVTTAEKIREELKQCSSFEVLQRTWENAQQDLDMIQGKNIKTFEFVEKVYHKKLNELASSPLPEAAE